MPDIIAAGPYIGDFENEILSFRPYIVWLYKNQQFKDFYVSSHSSRRFLYHWLPDSNFIPVDEKYNDDAKQDKYYNTLVTHAQYFKLIRWLRNKIYNNSTTIKKDDIKIYTVPYTKICDPVIYDKKIFTPIIMNIEKKNYVLYENEIYFPEYEYKILLDFDNYYDKIKALLEAKCVVCEAGLWTIISNMHKIPVFSWSEGAIGKYKIGGDYGFGNEDNCTIFCDNENTLKKTMALYLRRIMEK
jgi:hypothetical protein